jgi:hypothetical protein
MQHAQRKLEVKSGLMRFYIGKRTGCLLVTFVVKPRGSASNYATRSMYSSALCMSLTMCRDTDDKTSSS